MIGTRSMNDEELKETFPFGAMVIPRPDRDFSFAAQVSGDPYGEDPEVFRIWDSPEHATDLNRDLVQQGDGWLATAEDGSKQYFLRPLPEDRKVDFRA